MLSKASPEPLPRGHTAQKPGRAPRCLCPGDRKGPPSTPPPPTGVTVLDFHLPGIQMAAYPRFGYISSAKARSPHSLFPVLTHAIHSSQKPGMWVQKWGGLQWSVVGDCPGPCSQPYPPGSRGAQGSLSPVSLLTEGQPSPAQSRGRPGRGRQYCLCWAFFCYFGSKVGGSST